MHPGTWKNFERKVARAFGGERRGPAVGDGRSGSGRNDVAGVEDYSIECKYSKAPSYGLVRRSVDEAQSAAGPLDVAVGVVGKQGDPFTETLVVMKLEDFLTWFVHPEGE